MVAALVGLLLTRLTPDAGAATEPCEPWVRKGGWQLPVLSLVAQPEKAVESELVESDGLIVELKGFRVNHEVIDLRHLAGCGAEDVPQTFLLFAMNVFYFSGRPYAVQLNMDTQFEDGSIGCLARAWLSDQDGDGAFETLTLSPGASGIPGVPRAFLPEGRR